MTYPTYLVVAVAPGRVESFLNALSDLFRINKQDHWTADDHYSIVSIWADPIAPLSAPKVCIAVCYHSDYLTEERVRAVQSVE